MLLFLSQTLLIATAHVRVHRLLGSVGAVLAAVVFAVSMLVVVRAVTREASLVVFGDIALMILFAALVATGVRFRRTPAVHKRLMTIAAISIVAPAIARWPGAQAMLPFSVVIPQLSMFAVLAAYDVVSNRRVHAATAWGVASYIVLVGVSIPLALSGLGHALINALK